MKHKDDLSLRDKERITNISKTLDGRSQKDHREAVNIVRTRRKVSKKLKEEQKKLEKSVMMILFGILLGLPIIHILTSK